MCSPKNEANRKRKSNMKILKTPKSVYFCFDSIVIEGIELKSNWYNRETSPIGIWVVVLQNYFSLLEIGRVRIGEAGDWLPLQHDF